MKPCPFCAIVAGDAPATIVREWHAAIAILPLEPVTEGHTLVLPRAHVEDFTADAYDASEAFYFASQLGQEMGGPMNLITSKGTEATQTVFHLHFHLIPRKKADRLALPWRSRKGTHR